MNFEKDLSKALQDYELSLVEHYEKLPDPGRRKVMKGKKWYMGFAAVAAALVLLVLAKGLIPGAKSQMQATSPEMLSYSGGGGGEMARNAAMPKEKISANEEGADSGFSAQDNVSNDKIIRTYNLRIETKDIKTSLVQLEELVKTQGGYIENSSQSGKMEVGEEASAYYVLRIPKGKEQMVRAELEKMGQILYFSQYQDNVSRTYRDTEARAALIKAKEDKLMELLAKAENLEDLITIESKIMDLQFEREQMLAYLKDLDQMVDYDTYYVDMIQVKVFTEKGFGQKLKDSFTEGLADFWKFLGDSLLFIIYNWTFLLFILGIILGGSYVVKAIRKRRNHRKDKKQEE